MSTLFDRQHIWHPYSSMTNPGPVYRVKSANGVHLFLENGQVLVDGMSSWWSAIHGYNHPILNEAIANQTQKMAHVMFGNFTHDAAITLCEHLLRLTPQPLTKIFLADSGSVAVEVAIKMAIQYWQAQNQPQKHRLLALRNGYHGDTFAAMSVCDPITGMHHLFNKVLMQQVFSEAPQCRYDAPWEEKYVVDLEQKIELHHRELAAVILEPIVQAAGGMRFYSPTYLRRVRVICNHYKLLLIADEIATGFGRTGELFGCNHADISPDIMCLGKALTGGYMTMAATLCTDEVSEMVCSGESGVLMHGPTFMGNPLACAVASASIQLLLDSPWRDRVKAIEQQLTRELSACNDFPHVSNVRTLGAIGVVELKQALDANTLIPLFVKENIWIRPFGKLIYLMPPFIIKSNELSQLTRGMIRVIADLAAV
jgi:adenosylmethionine---8-amino-7-oxononanoate aminotransferase